MAESISPRCTIGKLSASTGCKVETIRYYEKIGLLPEPPRSAGGHRVYSSNHVERLSAILRCRGLGFSIRELRELLSLVDGGCYTCEEAQHIGSSHLKAIRRKVAALNELESTLTGLVARCSGDESPDCAFLDALFTRAEQITGKWSGEVSQPATAASVQGYE